MSIQFVDLRGSVQNNTTSTVAIPTTALLFGDIGLQTAGVDLTNQNLTRVFLNGYARVRLDSVGTTVTINIRKNGVIIFTTTFTSVVSGEVECIGFSTFDFPTAAQVITGQIQYTSEIFSSVASGGTTVAARTFGGVCATGDFSG